MDMPASAFSLLTAGASLPSLPSFPAILNRSNPSATPDPDPVPDPVVVVGLCGTPALFNPINKALDLLLGSFMRDCRFCFCVMDQRLIACSSRFGSRNPRAQATMSTVDCSVEVVWARDVGLGLV